MRSTFRKEERLHSKKNIAGLMASGNAFSTIPFRIIWMKTGAAGKAPVQVLFSVPKKKIGSSVTRNKIKRKMREAYRKNKNILYHPLENAGTRISLAFIYTSQQDSEYREIERKIILSLHRLAESIAN